MDGELEDVEWVDTDELLAELCELLEDDWSKAIFGASQLVWGTYPLLPLSFTG